MTTTHIKQGWHRRNGIPSSDLITLTEHFIRHGDHLTHVTVVTDPVYLTQPLVKSQDFTLNVSTAGIGGGGITTGWLYPCEYVDEAPGLDPHAVPSFMPGENPFTTEFAAKYKIPPEAALGEVQKQCMQYPRQGTKRWRFSSPWQKYVGWKNRVQARISAPPSLAF